MMNGNTLENFYTLPYEGIECFLEDLLEWYKERKITHKEDVEELKRICEINTVKLPKKNKK